MNPVHTAGLAGLIGALLAVTPSARAETHVFHLTGQVASGTTSNDSTSFSSFIGLTDDDSASGLLPALTVSTGDSILATIQLDRALDLPASVANPQPYAAYFGLSLGQFDPAQVQGGTTVFATVGIRFFDGSTEVQPGPAADPESGCGNLLCMGSVFVPATQAMHFDRFEVTAQIDGLALNPGQDLGQVYTVASPGQFSVFVLSAVPEPSSAGMWLAGLLAAGCWRIRRRMLRLSAASPRWCWRPTRSRS
jgi:MYXO-CTERM domain-containing protein